MKLTIPQNRIDAPIVVIHPSDEAWDTEKLEKSFDEHDKECPYVRYCSGATRYDLGAQSQQGSAQEMLSGSPVEFHMRRMSTLEMNEVQGLLEREIVQGYPIPRVAYLLACRYGLTAIKRGGSEVLSLGRSGNLTDADIEALGKLTDLGLDLVTFLGQASFSASRPLTDAEKKP